MTRPEPRPMEGNPTGGMNRLLWALVVVAAIVGVVMLAATVR